ncbi:2,3-butanediol dehydrogenase [Secundilactobacillus collinoides]|uniref:(R,R)-butanediol dehydrogenase n=2 Tax=Secundilactobacillus collinoides TaxID=33960 RepID=A0A0R2BD74_SECCO|nr:2,3-butanediol dehydrogenase [Secundilactobacillus collinoides]KRM75716.1 (R,R)-butanediol dehydrogenase [Secundilactobacillus collinoides DSM 20515 = JCM 1123]KZL42775.1 butanediol dehydrogenase [Secundilactobacillus collinoides]
MKAVRIYGEKDIRVEDVTIDDPKDDKVQVRVKYCGICGSDLHAYLEGWGLPTQPHPITGKTVPITLGHEFSGEVVKVGKDVDTLKIGDNVAIEPLIACGECENCRKGDYNFCNKAVAADGAGNFLGFSQDGGFAEFANVQGVFAHKLPEGMDPELGAVAEPTAVVYEAVKRSGLREGQNVAVMGAGPIGLLMALLAKISGANHVYIVDVSEVRLNKAKELGIENTINPNEADVNDVIRKDLPNGVDITFECAGVQATFNTALKVTKRTGVLQVVALFGKDVSMNMTDDVIMQGINITTTLCYNNSFPAVLGIINNHPETFRKIITKEIGLDQAVDEGIKALAEDKSQVKILVSPDL